MKKYSILLLLSMWACSLLQAQAPKKWNAAEIQQALQKLNVLGSALYVAAHPDDENTRLITYLANEELIHTAYLSLTRGDGGQNEIGPEIRELLGLIRTQELMAARRLDGGHQFFSRANDFGYSKSPEETLKIWEEEEVLADVVWTIRKFRPDVIINRFQDEIKRRTHGHHTASAILAMQAFDLAGDPSKFPEQLEYVDVWQPKRIMLNTSWWFYRDKEKFAKLVEEEGYLNVDVGAYNPLLGKSYSEIAAESRSMHKSQGFGSSGSRGERLEYLAHRKGDKATEGIFDDVDISWTRVEGGAPIGELLTKAAADYDPLNPSSIVPTLLKAQAKIEALEDGYWKNLKAAEIQEVIKACMGLFVEITSESQTAATGDSIKLYLEVVNRSPLEASLQSINIPFLNKKEKYSDALPSNQLVEKAFETVLGESDYSSQPYWLREEGSLGMFKVKDQSLRGNPENAPINVMVDLKIGDNTMTFNLPVVFKKTDPVKGEVYSPFVITPAVFANIQEKVLVFPDDESKKVQVVVKAGKADVNGALELKVPPQWKVKPEVATFVLNQKSEEQTIEFDVFPSKEQSQGEIEALIKMPGSNSNKALLEINYDHIPKQTLFPKSSAKVVKLDIKRKGEKIGYLMGLGDAIPASLTQIGYDVTLLKEADVTANNLAKYDAVILGIRVYNALERMPFLHPELMKYAEEGGTLIVQYNKNFGMTHEEVGPYPITISRDRVTVEEAEVRFLQADHPILNTPNKITSKDFDGWVQERGLYFPNEWDEKYTPLLSSNDPGEDACDGGLLVAEHGKGHFIYTGYSWFRELPAGVPGAYRLFTNLISWGQEE